MKYFSTFTGIGGFELGINKAYDNLYKETSGERDKGLQQLQPSSNGESRTLRRSEPPTCIGYSEINKYAIQIYQSKFPEHKNYGDITKINEKELPDFDLFVGGFPCQAFSIAGKRGGFDDTRGTLFFDCARILKEKQPRNFILENVKGLLSHDNGRTFKTIINTLTELGYCVEWQVLNAKNFGVPQNRERVFIVGHLGGIPERKVFPITGADREVGETSGVQSVSNPRELSRTLLARDYKDPKVVIQQLNNPTHSNDRVYGTDGLSPTLNTMQGGNRQPFIRNPYNGKQSEIESGTLGTSCGTTTGKTAQLLHKDTRIRRLTPLECERLMGYPDNWTEGLSDTQRYKTLGNGIVSNVVAEVVKRLYSNPSQITEDNKNTNHKE
jgi:DNA (cytosine-5)-methyltransferase 1